MAVSRNFWLIIIEANDGADALDKCRYNLPDGVLVDWDLPNITGVEFIEELRKLPDSQRVKVMYCTSEILVSEMTKAKRAGADGFLMKPFRKAGLEEAINDLLPG